MSADTVLITGAAGFIGFHTAARFLSEGQRVVGVDDLNSYYDPGLKRSRLEKLTQHENFAFHRVDIGETEKLTSTLGSETFRLVIHLAAQAGVRYSITHPHVYARSNLLGFVNILEESVSRGCEHFVFASSSSVYGMSAESPFGGRRRNQPGRFRSTLQLRNRTRCSRTPTQRHAISESPAFVSSRFMDLGAGRTWPTRCSLTPSTGSSPSRCSTTVTWRRRLYVRR